MKKLSSEKIKHFFSSLAAIVFWVLVWQIGAFFVNKKLILKVPMPLSVAKALLSDFAKPMFWKAVGTSVFHILAGYLCALVIGTAIGLLVESSGFFKHLSAPVLHMVRTVPVASFIFVAWLWVPSSALPGIIAFLIVVPIVVSHIEAGFKSENAELIEASRITGASKKDTVIKIKLPMLIPSLRTGCITGLGIAWKAGIAAEVICNPAGSLGALLQGGKASIEYDEVFAVTLMVILLSLLFESILKILWKEKK